MRFDAHIELRRILLGKTLPPFTPLQCFEAIGCTARFNANLPEVCHLPSGSAAEKGPNFSAAPLSHMETSNG